MKTDNTRDPLVLDSADDLQSNSFCERICCENILRRGQPLVYVYDDLPSEKRLATRKLHVVLVMLICLLPAVAIICLMLVAKLGILSMFVFHWVGAVAAPCLYMSLIDQEGLASPLQFLRRQFTGFAVEVQQWKRGIVLFLGFTALGFVVIVAISHWCFLVNDLYKPMKINVETVGIDFSTVGAVLFVLYFTFVNSMIEEIFWRGWLLERLGTSRTAIGISGLFYASYHFFVLYAVLPMSLGFNLWGSTLVTLFLVLAGVMFSYIHQIHGIILSWFIHAAADACIMLGLVAVYYQTWSPSSCHSATNNVTSTPSPAAFF